MIGRWQNSYFMDEIPDCRENRHCDFLFSCFIAHTLKSHIECPITSFYVEPETGNSPEICRKTLTIEIYKISLLQILFRFNKIYFQLLDYYVNELLPKTL